MVEIEAKIAVLGYNYRLQPCDSCGRSKFGVGSHSHTKYAICMYPFLNRCHVSLDMQYLRCTGILSVQFRCRTGYQIKVKVL